MAFNQTKNKLSGVSLIEVLIVIAIIAILSSVILVNLKRSLTRAEYAHAQMQLKTLTNLIAELEIDTGKSPAGLALPETQCHPTPQPGFPLNHCAAGLFDDVSGSGGCVGSGVAIEGGATYSDPRATFPNWRGPYAESLPLDPWGTSYYYDFDYYCGSSLKQKGCEGYYGKVVRAIVSFGPNKVCNYNWSGTVDSPFTSSDDIVYVLCGTANNIYP
ncbi:MAG: hypothetical protein QG620_399 [Patescibacteria group bacterium]|nr:hypothetical protein [Patescibacteria group bacterium]